MKRQIPTVDLCDYTSCDTSLKSGMIDSLGSGLVEFGFVTVEGHGIEPRLIREPYALWERFFALEEGVKRRYSGGAGMEGGARGFTPFGVEHAKDNPTPDLKEFWHVGQEPAAGHRLRQEYPPNVWPAELPELRKPTLELYRALEKV
ncbi:MAG: 2-oxoglutarate and iron-dependent oxygenase domain-containing protein, partial [Acidobacteriota bacterium]|nr:2-oxoglutarate and iron-dependent oxygenase domain-containing protein [Acidobacteriota bacterium]